MGGKKPINHDPSRGNCRSRRGRHDIITHHPHHHIQDDYNKKLLENEYSLFSSAWMFGLNSTNINDSNDHGRSNEHDNHHENHDNDTIGTFDSSPNTDDETDDHEHSKYNLQPQYQHPYHPQFQHLHPRFTYRPVQQQLVQPILLKQQLPQQQPPRLISTTMLREYEHKMLEKDHQIQALTSKLDSVSETVKILECKIETILSNLNKNISSPSSSTTTSQAQKEKDQRNRSLSLSPMTPLSPSVSCNYLAVNKQQQQQSQQQHSPPGAPSSPILKPSSSTTLPPSFPLQGIAESAVNSAGNSAPSSENSAASTVVPMNSATAISNNNNSITVQPISKLQERLSTLEGRQAMIQSKVSQLDHAFRGTNSAAWKKACEKLQGLLDKSVSNRESVVVTDNQEISDSDGGSDKRKVSNNVVTAEDVKSCHSGGSGDSSAYYVGREVSGESGANHVDTVVEGTKDQVLVGGDEKTHEHEVNDNVASAVVKTKKGKKKATSKMNPENTTDTRVYTAENMKKNNVKHNKNNSSHMEPSYYVANTGSDVYALHPQQQQPIMVMCPTNMPYQPIPMSMTNTMHHLAPPMNSIMPLCNAPPSHMYPNSSQAQASAAVQVSYPAEYDYNYEYEYDYDYVTGTPGVINGMAPSMSMPYVSDQQAAALADYQAAFAYNLQQEQNRQQYMYHQQQQLQQAQQQMKYSPQQQQVSYVQEPVSVCAETPVSTSSV